MTRPRKAARRRTSSRAAVSRPRAKRRTAKQTPKRGVTGTRAGAKRRATAKRRPARVAKRTTGRTARRGSRSGPRAGAQLRLVRRRAVRPKAVRPAFPQRAGAAAKHLVVFEILRARAAFHAAIQGLTPALAIQPIAPQRWSVRDTVAHLCDRDEHLVHQIEPVSRGTPPPWHADTPAEEERRDAEGLARLAHLGWDDALRRLHTARAELLEALEFVPAEPADPWSTDHPFGRMLRDLAEHDRHHADVVKRWRSAQGL